MKSQFFISFSANPRVNEIRKGQSSSRSRRPSPTNFLTLFNTRVLLIMTTVAFISSIGQSAHKCFAARRSGERMDSCSPGPLLSARPASEVNSHPAGPNKCNCFPGSLPWHQNDAICTILRVRTVSASRVVIRLASFPARMNPLVRQTFVVFHSYQICCSDSVRLVYTSRLQVFRAQILHFVSPVGGLK
jgi:hypothetical protein